MSRTPRTPLAGANGPSIFAARSSPEFDFLPDQTSSISKIVVQLPRRVPGLFGSSSLDSLHQSSKQAKVPPPFRSGVRSPASYRSVRPASYRQSQLRLRALGQEPSAWAGNDWLSHRLARARHDPLPEIAAEPVAAAIAEDKAVTS